MKSKFLLIISGTFLLLHSSCTRMDKGRQGDTSTQNQGAKAGTSLAMLTNDICNMTSREPQLNFSLDRNPESNVYVYTENQLNNGLANFSANFRYLDAGGNVQPLDPSDQKLSVSNLIQLYDALVTDSTVGYDPDSNYSALRMHFGMDGQKIILIYEPVALKRTGVPKECDVVGTNKYFRTDASNSFIAISAGTFNLLTNNLRGSGSNIYITHPNNPNIFSFINNTDATGDIRSNVMSMQEIVRMYCDNADYPNAADKINFSIVASQYAGSNYRMHVVAHYRMGLSLPSSGTFKNYAADYAEMCPVNCGRFNINYY
ncbi:MAG: hypothetical protein JNL13_13315 [Chitinophagaceae bacterium]|nr:hypothetical protein [Chitinophagaceae bacterium]